MLYSSATQAQPHVSDDEEEEEGGGEGGGGEGGGGHVLASSLLPTVLALAQVAPGQCRRKKKRERMSLSAQRQSVENTVPTV